MSVFDYTPPFEEIMHDGKPLMKVRGLSLEEVSRLIRDHLDDINRLVELHQGAQSEVFSRLMSDGLLLKLLTDAPVLLAESIAYAADRYSEEAIAEITRFPLALQLLVLRAALRLTLEDIGGPKGFAALVTTMRTT